MFRKVFFLSIVFILCLFACVYAARLVWDANTETDLAGYKVYRGQSGSSYDQIVDVANVTEYQIENLNPGTYYYAVTAYNTSGAESGFSNEVIYVQVLEGIAAATNVTVTYKETSMALFDHVQSIGSVTSADPFSLVFPGDNTANNMIVVMAAWDNGIPFVGISDSQGNSYTMCGVLYDNQIDTLWGVWFAQGIKAGPNTVTIDFTELPSWASVFILELEVGAGITVAYDTKNYAAGTGSTWSVNATAAQNNSLGVGQRWTANVGTPSSPWVERYAANGDRVDSRSGIAAGSATYSGTLTSGEWVANFAIFYPIISVSLEQKAFRGINRGIMRGAM